MPKMKSNKSVLSRFKVTGTGKLTRTKPGKRHKLTKKSAVRKNILSKKDVMDDSQTKMYKRMMLK